LTTEDRVARVAATALRERAVPTLARASAVSGPEIRVRWNSFRVPAGHSGITTVVFMVPQRHRWTDGVTRTDNLTALSQVLPDKTRS